MHDRPGIATGAGTESRDSTLAEGRVALDEVTRNTLVRKKGTPFLSCLPGEGKMGSRGLVPLQVLRAAP